MRPALSHHDPADRRSANRARVSRASIDLVLLLKTAALAISIHVVGNRRALQPDCGGENIDHRGMQASDALLVAQERQRQMEEQLEASTAHERYRSIERDGPGLGL